MTDPKLIGQHMLKPVSVGHVAPSPASPAQSISLSEALHTYLTIKGKGRGKTFHAAAQRACKYLVEATAHKDLHEYTRQDALAFRDYLIGKGLAGSSVSRVYNSLNSTLNFAINEHALELSNPFSRVYFDRTDKVKKRLPIPNDIIRQIQDKCCRIDDDMRWLIALISDTGLRLSEAAGLHIDDIMLNDDVSHVIVRPHPWRNLKTDASERKIPLVGASYWAAQRIVSQATKPVFAFPRYNRSRQTNGNSASAALNKWLKNYAPDGCSVHSFRHSMRDRLRAINCPTEMIDQIGGWSRETVGQVYGLGYDIEVLAQNMRKMTQQISINLKLE
ncbi:tyrosine-type recombinase/integrase [Rhodobacteraceae bacterium]|nr:tyrosine-type recombinase/integrase [Paracoccaceae bacterium]